MSETGPQRAIFLDRDGVLNRNVFYPDTGCWESPRSAAELELAPGVLEGLTLLRGAGYLLILVSNQPNAAKGKCSYAELVAIHERLCSLLAASGLLLDDSFYCEHHPEFTGTCECRKPSPHFLLYAARKWGIELCSSWMIGDRDTDVQCGSRAGARTVWIDTGEGGSRPSADAYARDLAAAARCILPA